MQARLTVAAFRCVICRVLLVMVCAIHASAERYFWQWAAAFLAFFMAGSIAVDLRLKMWYDELLTLYVARQASPGEIIKATLDGADGAAPLYAMIVHSILPWVRSEALAVRLPSTVGYCGMILCILAFCRGRLPAVYSFACAMFACQAGLYFATEGRSYGIMLGCAAGALLCWQMAAEGYKRRVAIPGLALCLATMPALHYYALFFPAPLLLGEVARERLNRKVDYGILASMAAMPLVLLLHYPVIEAGMKFQTHFWSRAHWGQIVDIKEFHVFRLAVLCAEALAIYALFPNLPADKDRSSDSLLLHEWVAVGTLSLMPPVVIAVSQHTTHAFVPRYVVWAVIGFAVSVAGFLCKAFRRSAVLGVILFAALTTPVVLQTSWNLVRRTYTLRGGEEVRNQLEMLPDRDNEPIVIANEHIFVELAYYAAPRLRERLVCLVSPELDVRYLRYDTDALLLSALRRRTSLRVQNYEEFLPEHRRFLLAATTKDYLPRQLAANGYRVRALSTHHGTPLVFDVQSPQFPTLNRLF